MLPRKLILENFMGHTYSDIDCTLFDSCLIVGANKLDPSVSNGTGKSTIFNAIDFCIFGEYQSGKIDELIRDGTDFCQVTFEFDFENNTYQTIRRRGKSGTNLYLNQLISDKWESLNGKTNSDTEIILHKLIKISYKAFKHSIRFAQSDLDGLPNINSDKRKDLLKEPLEIGIYNKYQKTAGQNLDLQLKDLEKIVALMENLGNPEDELKNISFEIEKTNIELNIKKDGRIKLQNELDKKRVELSDLERMINLDAIDINNQLLEIKKEIKNIEISLKKNKNELEILEIQLNEFKNELSKKQDLLKIKETNLINFKLENLRSLDIIQHELDVIIEKEQKGRVVIAKLTAEEQHLLKPVPELDKCNVCFQKITDEHKEKCINYAKERLIIVRNDLNNSNDIMEKCLNKKQILQNEHNNTSRKISQIDSLQLDIANSINNIDKNKELLNQYEKNIENKQNDIISIEKSLDLSKSREITLTNSAKELSINELNNKISVVKETIYNTEININKNIQEISSGDTLLGILKERQKSKEDNIVKLNEYKLKKLEQEKKIALHTLVVKAFSNTGIPNLIISSILNDLQIEANQLLQDLRPNLSFQFRLDPENEDNLDMIFFVNGKERSYKLLSGGQKVFINLSMKLGLSKIIQNRLGINIKFLLLDEVDQSLDESGVEAFTHVIKKWQNQFKIFVITHNKELKSKFNNIILVEADDINGSVAKLASGW